MENKEKIKLTELSNEQKKVIADKVAKDKNRDFEVKVGSDGSMELFNTATNTKVQDTIIVNEWFSSLANTLTTSNYEKSADLSGVMAELNPFKDDKEWENGQIREQGMDLKVVTDGYNKDFQSFEFNFNPTDRTVEAEVFEDSYKKSVGVKQDVEVVQRSGTVTGNWPEFISANASLIDDDLLNQLQEDVRAYIDTLPATWLNLEADSSDVATYFETELNTYKDLKIPSTAYNESGFVGATGKANLQVIRDQYLTTSLGILPANIYASIKTENDLINASQLPLADGVNALIFQKGKFAWKDTLNERGATMLDAFQMKFQGRLWYGMKNVPWLNGVALVDPVVDPDPPEGGETKKSKKITVRQNLIKQLENKIKELKGRSAIGKENADDFKTRNTKLIFAFEKQLRIAKSMDKWEHSKEGVATMAKLNKRYRKLVNSKR